MLQERAHQPEDASLAVKPPNALEGPLRRGERLAGPAQAPAGVIDDVGVGIEQGVFEVCEVGIIQAKLALQGAIGDAPTTPQHVKGLVQNLLKGHAALPRTSEAVYKTTHVSGSERVRGDGSGSRALCRH